MARPSILTDRLIAEFCAYVKMGVPPETACRLCELPRATFYRWKKAYSAGKARGLHRRFFREMEAAQAAAVQLAVGGILAAGKKQWQAYAWYLERRAPEEFGRKRMYETGGEAPKDQESGTVEVTQEELEAIAAIHASDQNSTD